MVEKNMPGFAVGELEDLCGMRANPVSSLFLEDVRLPETHLLGRLGDGLKIGLSATQRPGHRPHRHRGPGPGDCPGRFRSRRKIFQRAPAV